MSVHDDVDCGVDWRIYRILTSQHIKATMIEMRDEWSMLDLAQAHAVLDAIEEVEASRG